jgi:3-phenylpropionate/cinnamic acid dioxygenase small subunit
MADYGEIQQLLARYCFAHDERDLDMLTACFASNVSMMGVEGRDNVVAAYGAGYQQLSAKRRHVISNIFIAEDGDERAVVNSYITLYLIHEEQLSLHLTGVYRDTVVREDGAWKIQGRDVVLDVAYNPGDVQKAPVATYRG